MADVLFRTTFLESWGSGASRIVAACRKQNVPEPEWTTDGGFVIVTFRRPKQAEINKEHVSSKETSWRQAGDKLDTSSDTTSDTTSDTSSERMQSLVNKLPLGYLSLSDMMKACNMQSRPSFLVDYITPAIEGGYIERKYPDSPNHPKQQYRLTPKGLTLKRKDQ